MSTDDFVTDLTPSARIPLHTFTTEALAERDRQVAEQAGERIARAIEDVQASEGLRLGRNRESDGARVYTPTEEARIVALHDAAQIARADSAAPARPTTDAEDPCATCGKPRREHRLGYSAYRCTFTACPTTDDREVLVGRGGLTGTEFVITAWHIEDGRVVADEKVTADEYVASRPTALTPTVSEASNWHETHPHTIHGECLHGYGHDDVTPDGGEG